jgi:hypothetical protein
VTFAFADRVRETTTTTGAGTYTLAGAVTGFQSFSVVGNGNVCPYVATDGADWEAGLGTWATGGTLARTLILASSNSNNAVNWSAGSKTVWLDFPASLISLSQQAGVRNMIINPTFQVAQRGASVAVSGTTVPYTVDQWAAGQASGTVAMTVAQQSNPATGVPASLRVQRNSGNTNTAAIHLIQTKETLDVVNWQGEQVTLSFYAKKGANYSPTSSILVSRVITGTGADEGRAGALAGTWTGQATTSAQNNTLTTTRQQFFQTFTIPSSATELAIDFQATPTGTASTNDWFEIDSVQLEPGPVATSFELRPYELDFRMCLRYLYVRGGEHLFETIAGGGFATGSTQSFIGIPLPTKMRAAPSLTVSSVSHFAVGNGTGGRATCSAISLTVDASSVVASIEADVSSGLTAGRPADLETNNTTSARLYLSAEL